MHGVMSNYYPYKIRITVDLFHLMNMKITLE